MNVELIVEGIKKFDDGDDDGYGYKIDFFINKYGKIEDLNPILSTIPESNLLYYKDNTFIFNDYVLRFLPNKTIYQILKDSPDPNLEQIDEIYEYTHNKSQLVNRFTDEYEDTSSTKYIIKSKKYTKFDSDDFDSMDETRKEKFKNDICNAIINLHKKTGLFHSDISFDNIVYDSDTDNFILIDYGMISKDEYSINANNKEFADIGLLDCLSAHFKNKYLKYKSKYLSLRNKLNI